MNVLVNGQIVVDIPAGLNHLTGTGEFDPYEDTWVSFGPFDITSIVTQGKNSIVFRDPLTSHTGLIKNVTIIQGTTVLLSAPKTRFISPTSSATYTFSNPPLVLTSFTVSNPTPSVDEDVTFTATFTGGTAPFTCSFNFGDGESMRVNTTSQSCTATHDYDDPGNFTATVKVRGSTFADKVKGSITVIVQEANNEDPLVTDDIDDP